MTITIDSTATNGVSPANSATVDVTAPLAMVTVAPARPKAYFAGTYIADMRDLGIAALLSGMNGVIVSSAGWGKTDVFSAMCREILGRGNYKVFELTSATKPEVVAGMPNVKRMLDESVVEREPTGSAFDARFKALIFEEVGRVNPLLIDEMLHILDRKDLRNPPPVLATTNFMPTDDRAKAMLDRFALWHWVNASIESVPDMVTAMANAINAELYVPGRLPTFDELQMVWAAVPTEKSTRAIVKFLALLANEAQIKGFILNPRRLRQWTNLLFRAGVYYSGTADFDAVPAEATKLLRFAWPAETYEMYRDWSALAKSVVDPLDSALAEIFDQAYAASMALAGKPSDDFVASGKLTRQYQGFYETLAQLGNEPEFRGDPRLSQARTQLDDWFRRALRGEIIERI